MSASSSELPHSFSGALAQSVDREQQCLIVLGASGNVLFASKAAEELARRSAWLRLNRSGVHLTNPALDQRLQHGLQDCGQTVERKASCVVDELEVIAQDGGHYRFSLAPLMFQGQLFGVDQPAVIVTINRLATSEIDVRERLKGLTGAELTLALAVARGCTLAAYARLRGISLHTVRAQLKIIFQKTGIHRQAELVGLVLNRESPAAK